MFQANCKVSITALKKIDSLKIKFQVMIQNKDFFL